MSYARDRGLRGKGGPKDARRPSSPRPPQHGPALPRAVEGRVTGLAAGGDGVVASELGEVFCAGVFPGERVRLTGLRRRGKLLFAGDFSLLEPSPSRRTPPCEHARECGGCPWMALEPAAQREARRAAIERALAHARVSPREPIEMDEAGRGRELGYRSRARMRFEEGVLGYRAASTRRVVPIRRCLVQSDAIAAAAQRLAGALEDATRDQPGGACALDVHLGTGNAGVVLQLRSDAPLAPAIYAAAERLVGERVFAGVGILAGGASAQAVFGDAREASPASPGDEDASEALSVPLGGFSQANPEVNRALVAAAVRWAEARDEDTLELYAGSGNLSAALAAEGARVVAVERDPAAAALAAQNLAARGLSAKVLAGDAAEAPARRFSRVVLDPPREGARDALERIVHVHRPERIVYVSCDPRTLARDLAELCRGGYQLERVRGFDMFPETPHVETLALLTRAVPA